MKKTVYRGFDGTTAPLGKESVIWFAVDPAVAFGYANHRKNPTVREYTVSPKNPLDVGRSEQRMKVSAFLAKISGKSSKRKQVEEEALGLFREIVEEFGTNPHDIHKFWFESDKVAQFIDLMGFDAIITTEDDHETIGILRKHSSLIK